MRNVFYYDQYNKTTWSCVYELMPHVIKIANHSENHIIKSESITYLYNNLGLLYKDQAKYQEAEAYWTIGKSIIEQQMGNQRAKYGEFLNKQIPPK